MSRYYEKLKVLQKNAYAPYSNFKVAAILVMEDGTEYPGVNIENVSFGSTICAERSAFASAISLSGKGQFHSLHLLGGEGQGFTFPCGMCRQVINELVDASFSLVLYDDNGKSQSCAIKELLPNAFTANFD